MILFVFPSNFTCAEALLSSKWLHICLPMGSSELISLSALLAYAAFASSIKLYYLNPWVFFLFCFYLIEEGSEWEAGWVFGCWLGQSIVAKQSMQLCPLEVCTLICDLYPNFFINNFQLFHMKLYCWEVFFLQLQNPVPPFPFVPRRCCFQGSHK